MRGAVAEQSVFDSCPWARLNFLHIKENAHSPSLKSPSSGTERALGNAVSPPPLPRLPLSGVVSVSALLRLPPLRLLSRRSAPARAGFALPLPLLPAADFVPSLRSALQ